MKVISDDTQWEPIGAFYLSDRIVVVAYSNVRGSVFRLILVNVVAWSHRVVTVEAPVQDNVKGHPHLLMITSCTFTKPRLNVYFSAQHSDPLDEEIILDREFVHASYDISVCGSIDSPIKAISWQSVVFPSGRWPIMRGHWYTGYPPVVHLGREDADTCSIVFEEGSWKMQRLNEWLSSSQATSGGAKWMNAAKSFGALSSFPADAEIGILLRFTPMLSGPSCDDAVFMIGDRELGTFTNADPVDTFTMGDGILERSLSPHSLKRLAAEAFCKAFPDFDFAELKKMIGFDVFDGIYHEREPW